MQTRRSLWDFLFLVIIALAATLFVLHKANQAIGEIENVPNASAYLGEK